ncbi:unnamed protein product [[Candida] boidinii]|nr:unnamed protein product [[Candida] boidinii]GMG39497.1 unnamed protein product [[Candida] boidinii]
MTSRRLHSHDIRPSVSEIDWQNEASCYGYDGFDGDPNDDFIVEIVKKHSVPGIAQERLRAIDTVFRLHHAMTGCYLFSHETKLPKWGFEQQEVTCATQGIDPLSYWVIEENTNVYLDREAEKISYKPLSFLQKVMELHRVMWKINGNLDGHHEYQSTPDSWPALVRGIAYWSEGDRAVYLLGNPIVWWLASFIVVPYSIFVVAQLLKWQFGYQIVTLTDPTVFNFASNSAIFFLGWLLHYAPSFLMARQLFLHHYLPALYFSILALGQSFELLYSYIFSSRKFIVYGFQRYLVLGITIVIFIHLLMAH